MLFSRKIKIIRERKRNTFTKDSKNKENIENRNREKLAKHSK